MEHIEYEVNPDLAMFESNWNGYAINAIIGKKFMTNSEKLLLAVHLTERLGSVAALATIKYMKKINLTG